MVAYVAAMWFWHVPVFYEAALDHSFIHVLEHLTFAAAGAPVLVAPALPDPLAACASAASAPCSTWRHEDPGRLPRHPARVLAGAALRLLRLRGRHALGPDRRSTTSSVAGVLMALEQSLVMGVALAYLFIRMLSEADEADEREERYGTV